MSRPPSRIERLLGRGAAGGTEFDDERVVAGLKARLLERALTPRTLGRYQVYERLGAGAYGSVYRARDPELDRDVAIKLLRPPSDDEPKVHRRLLREARALARVDHPNVIDLYDVGTLDEGGPPQVYIVMALLQGGTLADWLAQAHPWRQVLDVFAAAAEGLHAVHEAGLAHCDFKPANVLLDGDGRPVVADLGLARRVRRATEEVSSILDMSQVDQPTVIGTPRYMAPEQHYGEPADARCDQYAFCVSLYEAIFGAPPFTAGNLGELLDAKERGPEIPRSDDVPSRVLDALRRGLDPDSTRRFPSMLHLRARLVGASSTWRRVALAAGIAGVGALAGASLLLDDEPRCPSLPEVLEGWPQRRTAMRSGLAGLGTAAATETFERVEPRLAEHHESLTRMWAQTCEAELAEAEPMRLCLSARARAWRRVADTLSAPNPEHLDAAVQAVDSLREPDSCDPSAGDFRAHHPELWAELDEAQTLTFLGRFDEAEALRVHLQARAEELEAEQLRRAVVIQRGLDAIGRGAYDEARIGLERAYFEAVGDEDPTDALTAARTLADIATRIGDADDAAAWVARARTQRERLPAPSPAEDAMLRHIGGMAKFTAADIDGALVDLAHAHELMATANLDHTTRNTMIIDYCHVLQVAGRPQRVVQLLSTRIDDAVARLGQNHPNVASLRQTLANAMAARADYELARRELELALAVSRRRLGPDHATTAGVRLALAQVLSELDEHQAAVEHADAAMEVAQHHVELGPQMLAMFAATRELVSGRAGDTERALRGLAEQRRILEGLVGPDHYLVADVAQAQGRVLLASDEPEAARRVLDEALRLHQHAHHEGHPSIADTQVFLARAELDAGGSPERAAALISDALDAYHRIGSSARHLLDVRELATRAEAAKAVPH